MLVHSNANYITLRCHSKFSDKLFYRIVKKVKLVLFHCTSWKRMGEYEIWLYSFLILVVDAVEWSISRLDCFTTRKELRYRLNRRACGRQRRCASFGEDTIEDTFRRRYNWRWEFSEAWRHMSRPPVSKFRRGLLPSWFRIKKTGRAVNLRQPYTKELRHQPSNGRSRKAMTVQVRQSTTAGGKINHLVCLIYMWGKM